VPAEPASLVGVIIADPNPIGAGAWVAISGVAEEIRVSLDEDGRFAFSEVPANQVLSLWLGPGMGGANLYRLRSDLVLSPGEHREIEIRVGMPSVIRGRVVDAKGEPLGGARVAVLPPQADWRETAVRVATTTDAKGCFYVGVEDFARVGPLRLVAEAVDRGYILEEMLIHPSEMEVGGEIRVELTMGLTISGVALGPKGRPIAGATVHILEDYEGPVSVRRPVEGRVRTDAKGRFTDDAYRPGVYRIFLEGRTKGGPVALVREGVRAGSKEVELRFPGYGALDLSFVGGVTGEPVEPAEAVIEYIWGHTGDEEHYVEWDDLGGRSSAKLTRLPQGHYRIGAHHAEYESLFSDLIFVEAGAPGKPITFRLTPR